MTPELRERLARACARLVHGKAPLRTDYEITDAILSELTAAGYAVVTEEEAERWKVLVNSVAMAWNRGLVPGNDAESFDWAVRCIYDHTDKAAESAAKSTDLIKEGQKHRHLVDDPKKTT